MTLLGEDFEDWDNMTDEERERVRAMLRDLGLEDTEDPDAFE